MNSYKLPTRKHLVHKPVEFRNLCKEAKERIKDVRESQWLWQMKYDGCHGIVVVHDGGVQMFSREGNEVKAADHILKEFRDRGYPNGAYFGEYWHMGRTFPEISGTFRRQYSDARSAEFCFKLFDHVSLDEFGAGTSPICYGARWDELQRIVNYRTPDGMSKIQCAYTFVYSDANFDRAEEATANLRLLGHIYGLDGYVAKRYGGDWTAGDGKKGQTIKVKDHISVDLRCVAVEEGKGKFEGMIGSLLVEWKGQVVPVSGGRLTNQERHNIDLCGKIVEVHALGLTPDGQLREPRYQRIRYDKTEPSE
jgi:DNA ligase-1